MLKSLFGLKSKTPAETTAPAPVTVSAPIAPTPVAPAPVMPAPVIPEPPKPVVGAVVNRDAGQEPESARPAGAVQASKARDISLYRSLLAGLYDGVLIFDSKGSIIGSNQRAEYFLGYSERELWGMQCEELVVGMNARVLYKLHSNAEAGRFSVVNGTCKRKDGTTFPSEIAISRIRLLNEGDLIFSIRNVERREKVREQREMSEEAIRYAGAGIVVCSTEGSIEFVNPAFLKLMSVENEMDVLKHMIGDFCSSYEVVKAMMHTPSTQGIWLGSLELVTPKGGRREVTVSAALSQVRRGGVPRLVLTMTPVPKAIA